MVAKGPRQKKPRVVAIVNKLKGVDAGVYEEKEVSEGRKTACEGTATVNVTKVAAAWLRCQAHALHMKTSQHSMSQSARKINRGSECLKPHAREPKRTGRALTLKREVAIDKSSPGRKHRQKGQQDFAAKVEIVYQAFAASGGGAAFLRNLPSAPAWHDRNLRDARQAMIGESSAVPRPAKRVQYGPDRQPRARV
jgi:hypothetical protein